MLNSQVLRQIGIQVSGSLVFLGVFVIVGLAFPFSSPGYFSYNYDLFPLLLNRPLYFAVVAVTVLAVLARREVLSCNKEMVAWVLYFAAVIFVMLLDDKSHINLSVLYLFLFVAPVAVKACQNYIFMAVCAAISFNALYGLAGMLAANLGIDYRFFPIVPYIYDGDVRLGRGFYQTFSSALFFQTNAAGAIFGTAFCFFLYCLASGARRGPLLALAVLMSLLGLLLSRSLSALLLTALLCLVVMRGRALAGVLALLAIYASLIFLAPGGVLGVNASYLQHKIETSAIVKLSLLADNVRRMAEGGLLAFILPGREPPPGTENTFIDLAFQFGFVQVLFFYGWCALSLRFLEDRQRVLLLFPLILSFLQNSAFTTPVVFILGLALAICGTTPILHHETESIAFRRPEAAG